MTGRGRAGPISRLPSIWSRYLAAWESTWYPGWAEQHADYLVITSLHIDPPAIKLLDHFSQNIFVQSCSTYDDPGLHCAMLPWSYFWTEHTHMGMRWTMCAQDVCFGNELLRYEHTRKDEHMHSAQPLVQQGEVYHNVH